MLFKWMPWKFLVGRAARDFGMIDPVQFLARLRGFSQPSQVQEPIELLRAGVVFQARGLINAKVIQYNLDWVWPYWVEKQFNPDDPSFMPCSFSLGHVNLTQRNWTAVGRGDLPIYPIVDPRGLVTPLYDGWSLDFWIIEDGAGYLLPSRQPQIHQRVVLRPNFCLHTKIEKSGQRLFSEAWIQMQDLSPVLRLKIHGQSDAGGWLVVSIRPYNAEGISFVENLSFNDTQTSFRVNKTHSVTMDQSPEIVRFSNFRNGDVFHRLLTKGMESDASIHCPLGMATGAALFKLEKKTQRTVQAKMSLKEELRREFPHWPPKDMRLELQTEPSCQAVLPDSHYQFLFDNAVHTLRMLSAGEIYPGPYTYKRFWFRDSCLMLNALLCIGDINRARRHIGTFFQKQKHDGYFRSQEGEWDSNGQVLSIIGQYQQISGQTLPKPWMKSILKAARWILTKRTPRNSGKAHAGLLPAGFSAEHLGPNDFYFWDDFWSIAGLKTAAHLVKKFLSNQKGDALAQAAEEFEDDVFACINAIDPAQSRGAIPASPYRRMDAGAIGSMVADYPLQLTPVGQPRIKATLEHLLTHHMNKNGFFQDMIHSGINAYLTLDLAQTLLRMGDSRYGKLMETVAKIASPTGNWPEAVHPFSGGGCMGDGQHGWAAAEWIMMIRNLFVREEPQSLIIGSGLPARWFDGAADLKMAFGPTGTAYGAVAVTLTRKNGVCQLQLDCQWRDQPVPIEIRVPGFKSQSKVDPNRIVSLIPP